MRCIAVLRINLSSCLMCLLLASCRQIFFCRKQVPIIFWTKYKTLSKCKVLLNLTFRLWKEWGRWWRRHPATTRPRQGGAPVPVGASHTPHPCPHPAYSCAGPTSHCPAGHHLIRAHGSAKRPSISPSPKRRRRLLVVGPALDFFSCYFFNPSLPPPPRAIGGRTHRNRALESNRIASPLTSRSR